MTASNHITFEAVDFQASSIDESTVKLMETMEKATGSAPRWYQVEGGLPAYRRMQKEGKTQFPVPPVLPEAQDAMIPSRESGREIPIRFYKPDLEATSRGVYLYFHGGGFILGSHRDQDEMLKAFANTYKLTAVSVGYRMDPFPAGIEDCVDVAEYLIDHETTLFSAPLRVIGGASAGGNYAALATFELMRTRPQHRLDAVLLVNGWFDVTMNLPSTLESRPSVIVDREMLVNFVKAYAGDISIEARRNPGMSPLFENLQKLAGDSPFRSLPPALFTCGTADPLLDDSLLMSVKWLASGSEARIELYPGAPHMFSAFKGKKVADDAAAATAAFLKEKLGV